MACKEWLSSTLELSAFAREAARGGVERGVLGLVTSDAGANERAAKGFGAKGPGANARGVEEAGVKGVGANAHGVNAHGCAARNPSPVFSRREAGQMTIELAVAMPVLIVVAVIAVNACTFFADCAVFDRIAREAVRVHATAPAYGQDAERGAALVEETVRAQMDADNLNVSVEHGVTGADFDEYTATLTYHPTLFGLGLRAEVFGVSLPQLVHEARYVVDGYKPGVIA